ncbi:stage II sporulation protein M [Sinomonas humi]|uniref:Stage II sporulation protein M n=1 Tax=Sinomonas humi TaxID=1338436 RepID=A0A0B2AHE5_9MICC|nr:stage II sporulation protein M [Sinomonas humi]KHL01183.1 hypothetical protein LK10_17270 [Sinomonas humi]
MMGSAKEIASQSWPYALALSLALLAAGAAIGAQADVGLALDAPSPDPQGTEWTEAFVKVLLNNASTGALLYAGAATAGTATLIVWPIVAAYIGATFRASAGAVGVENVVGTIWPYAPLEFVGMCLAAAAGLMPLVSGLRAAFEPQSVGPARAYAREIPSTLKVFLASLTLIALAAAVEAAVIAF